MKLGIRLKSYLTANPWGYIVAGLNGLALAYYTIDPLNQNDATCLSVGAHVVGFLVGLGISYQNISSYRRIRKSMELNGYNKKWASKKLNTWCERKSMRAAASETGHLEDYLTQCEEEGHKWYHVLYHRGR